MSNLVSYIYFLIYIFSDVPAKTKYLAKFSLTPKRSGRKKRHINASFECKELIDIIGECMIRVVDDEDDA